MPLRIEEVKIEDLIRELSPDALRYFAEIRLSDEWPSYENALSGKFVRLGEVVLLGATIDHGPVNRGERHTLKHLDMLLHGSRGMGEDIAERIKATAPEDAEYLEGKWPLVDAGGSKIRTDQDGQPTSLSLYGRSYVFGQGSESIRQQTGEIAQRAVGTEISVTAKL